MATVFNSDTRGEVTQLVGHQSGLECFFHSYLLFEIAFALAGFHVLVLFCLIIF